MSSYDLIETEGVPIKAWTRGVAIEDAARKQLENVARLPIVFRHVAVMPDVHFGIGATVGSVVPTQGAIIPAAVGVDIGCGMMAVRDDARARASCPDYAARAAHARSRRRCRTAARRTAAAATAARGASVPTAAGDGVERRSTPAYERARRQAPEARPGQRRRTTSARSAPATTSSRSASTSATASGSCCTPARAASATGSARYFIELAKQDMRAPRQEPAGQGPRVPRARAPSTSTTTSQAVGWAQHYAMTNRELMMDARRRRARASRRPAAVRARRAWRSTATTTTSRASTTSARTCS